MTKAAVLTVDAAEERALADYRKVAGRLLRVAYVSGYIGDTDDQWDGYPAGPILVRVRRHQDTSHNGCILRWADGEWIDPYWDVDVLPGQLDVDLRSAWTDGTSYNVETGETECDRWEIVPENPVLLRARWAWEDFRMAWHRWRSGRRRCRGR